MIFIESTLSNYVEASLRQQKSGKNVKDLTIRSTLRYILTATIMKLGKRESSNQLEILLGRLNSRKFCQAVFT